MQLLLQNNLVTYQFQSAFMDILEEISRTIIKASTSLSQDKQKALKRAIEIEDNENAKWALTQILENYQVAQNTRFPLCDDTGIPHVII